MQRSLSLPADPIELRQKNFLFGRKKKKVQKLEKPLTSEEAERLLISWRETSFAEFNSWIQIAKAQLHTEIQENTEGYGRKASKMFCCNLTLKFEEDSNLKMVSTGFARSKKDARRNAIEKVVVELIKNGEIGRGLRNNDLGQGQNNLNDLNHQNIRVQKETIDESVQKKVQKLTKKMQESLKYGRFFEACESLSQIVARKKPDWNEIAFIWSHALLKKDFSYVKAIIDLIQFKKVQPSLNASVFEELKACEQIKKGNQETEEDKAKNELIKKYGNGRLNNDNPYEVLDTFNVEVNLPEIDTTKEVKEITEEEASAEIVKEPLSVDLNKLFVTDSAEGYSLGDLNNILNQLPDSFANPTTFADPKLLNLGNAVELNKLLHQLTFQPLSLNLFGQAIDPNNQNIFGSISSTDLSNLINQVTSLTQQQQEIIKKDPVDDFKTPSRSYTTEDSLYNRTPQIDLSTSREVKNPSINYLSFKLLNEFYDTLLYVGDLNFSLSVAEILYARIRLDDEDFINSFACYYFANKKNMLMIEMIESMYLPLTRNKNKNSDGLCSLEGSVEKIGNKFSQEVLLFSPLASPDQIENKVLRRTHTEGKESYGQISEGEFVKLVLCSDPNASNGYLSEGEDSMGYFNQGFFFGQQQQQNAVTSSNSSSLNGYEMIACVREIQKDCRVKLFVLPTREQSEMLGVRGKIWKITKLNNRTTIDKTSEALETFCTQITMAQPLLQIILSPPICNNNAVQQLAESKVFFHNKPHNLCFTNLNISQQKALTCATTQLLTLIQGPPGTGKTTTAVEVVLEWLRLAPIPILACADSNIAVDRLYEEFKAAGIRCMRIGPGYDEKNDLKNDRNYAMYTALCNAKQYHNANNVRFGIIKKKISEAQVVCATCVGSTSEYLKGITFQRVILDEVTQANEIVTLIPLIKGCQQLVLVGDHKQLPPTVLSTFAQSKGMTISLFERLVKQGVVPNLLNVQYRMHSSISQFPSHQFYDNMLENGTDDVDRPMVQGFNWPNSSMRVAFVNVKGFEEVYASSIQNSKEVEVVVEILVKLLPFNHISTIGIITPYDAQKKRVRNEVNLQAKKYPQLFGLTQEEADKLTRYSVINDIDTVDGYQGMEREMIIFSAVRSNHSGSLGFLRDPRRLNVTLTRAKKGLIIVGDMHTLMHDQNWREWIQWCKKNQAVLHYK